MSIELIPEFHGQSINNYKVYVHVEEKRYLGRAVFPNNSDPGWIIPSEAEIRRAIQSGNYDSLIAPGHWVCESDVTHQTGSFMWANKRRRFDRCDPTEDA